MRDGKKRKEYLKRYYQEHREERLAKAKEWYWKHRKERKEYMKKWHEKNRNYRRKENRKIKEEVIFHYSNGSMKCACCGENHIEFLTLDHIEGKGRQHKKEINRSGISFYKWLRMNNFPEDIKLQVLCYNCNCAKGHLGYCPHQKERIA